MSEKDLLVKVEDVLVICSFRKESSDNGLCNDLASSLQLDIDFLTNLNKSLLKRVAVHCKMSVVLSVASIIKRKREE